MELLIKKNDFQIKFIKKYKKFIVNQQELQDEINIILKEPLSCWFESAWESILRYAKLRIDNNIYCLCETQKRIIAVKDLSFLTADEIISRVRRIDKFYMSDSMAVGNCVYGTRMWLKSIGLCPDADSVSGEELAAALMQHRDKAKDPNFLRVLASKI